MTTAKKMTANDRQVGGDHYQTGGTQHWDMFGPEYLMGNATKYVSRWRKKNGVQDLEKALHYSEKLLETVNRGGDDRPRLPCGPQLVDAWAPNQGISWVETVIIKRLMFWTGPNDIREAVEGIKHLIATAQPLEVVTKKSGFDGPKMPGLAIEARKAVASMLPQSLMADRRVPRHNVVRDADENHHSSLHPWQMPRDWYTKLGQERRALLDAFYTQKGDRMVLDAFVDKVLYLPRELGACYTWVTNTGSELGYWLIQIDRVPEDMRDDYPRLNMECNMKELEEMPRWQQGLYEHHEKDGKYRLLDRALLWGPEL